MPRSIGAEVTAAGVQFVVWAPSARRVEVCSEDRSLTLEASEGGYFSGLSQRWRAGDTYHYRLNGEHLYPDPASRFQPEGPHGPSQVVDAKAYPWADADWRGPDPRHLVLYELHLGTFTREGTYEAAETRLAALAELGVSGLELLPLAEFSGRFGWGYDGVCPFAPFHHYGPPDALRHFIDRAHTVGLSVILDVVYNHMGPDGNYFKCFSPAYFTDRYKNEWGEAINFDGEDAGPVRDYFIANAAYWIDAFHFDGLRLDATQQIFDRSGQPILAAIRRAVASATERRTYVVAENEPQDAALVRAHGIDALWNDDFHHSAVVALTRRAEAYYTDYSGSAQELASCSTRGFLYQGQWYTWQKQPRGTPCDDLPPHAFVSYLENHDQVANSIAGERLHQRTSPGRHRALTALLLLGPQTPMLFAGQEWNSTSPFYYFADHKSELAAVVRRGRREFLCQFPSIEAAFAEGTAPPDGAEAFAASKLEWEERESHSQALALHRDLLGLRRDDTVLAADDRRVDSAALSCEAFVLRWRSRAFGDRLLIVNLGGDWQMPLMNEPLLAPRRGRRWQLCLTTERSAYGGQGAVALATEGPWRLPAESALFFTEGEK